MKTLILFVTFFYLSLSITCAEPAWNQTKGPVYSGRIQSITADSRGVLYAIAIDNSLYRRSPQDSAWVYIQANAYAVAIDHDDNAYIGRDMGYIDMYDKDFNFLKRARYGGIWDQEIESIIPDAGGNLYTITAANDLTSLIDTTQIWNIIREYEVRGMAVDSGSVAMMIYHGDLFRSLDTGRTWNSIIVKDEKDFYVADIEYNKKYDTWMALCKGSILYVSTDSGLTWSQKGDKLPLTYIREFYISKSGAAYIAYDSAAYRSLDGGGTWSKLLDLGLDKINDLIEVGNDLYVCTDNQSVLLYDLKTTKSAQYDNGFILSNVWKVAVNIDGTVFATTYKGIYKSTNEGDSWELIQFPNGIARGKEVYCTRSGLVFARDDNDAYVSRDLGSNWEQVKIHPDSNAIYLQVMAEDDRGRLYAGYNGIIYSDDGGVNWERVELYYTYKNILSIACYGDILAFTVQTQGPYLSKDRGATYHNLQFPVIYDNGHPDSYVRFNSKGELYVFINREHSQNMICRSDDGGNTFEIYNNLREDGGFIVLDSADNLYSIGQRSRKYPNGLIRSTDGGASWNRYSNEDIRYYNSNDICFGKNGKAYLAVTHRGVFRNDNVLSLRELTVEETELIVSPNPAEEEISIQLNDSQTMKNKGSIQIVNMVGDIVYRDNVEDFSNEHRISVAELPQGTYFVRAYIGGKEF